MLVNAEVEANLKDNGWQFIPVPGVPAPWVHPEIDDTTFWPPMYVLVINGIIVLRNQEGLPLPTIDELERIFLMGDYAPEEG